MKTVGIVADDYKLKKFKEELAKAKFTNYTLHPFMNKTTTIKVLCEDNQVDDLKRLCTLVEIHFKRGN